MLRWEGEGPEELGIVDSVSASDVIDTISLKPGDVLVRVDPKYYRPAEVESLLGDPSRAHAELGWQPTTTLDQMIAEMLNHDLDQAKRQALLKSSGFSVNNPHDS